MNTKELLLEEIRIDGGTQPRAEINEGYVAELAENIENGDIIPSTEVFYDGKDYWLADGFHRYHAHRKAQMKRMTCCVRNGTNRDAILFSVGANRSHGLRRTNADKRLAVTILLKDAEWAKWSDRAIADKCGVSHTYVSEIRFCINNVKNVTGRNSSVTGNVSSDNRVFTSKSGKTTEMDVSAISSANKKRAGGKNTEINVEPPKPTQPPATDKVGVPFPSAASAELFTRGAELKELANRLSEIKSQVIRSVDSKDTLYIHLNLSYFQASIENTYTAIKRIIPHAVCPYCQGRQKTCKACKGSHLVPKEMYENYTPEDLKV